MCLLCVLRVPIPCVSALRTCVGELSGGFVPRVRVGLHDSGPLCRKPRANAVRLTNDCLGSCFAQCKIAFDAGWTPVPAALGAGNLFPARARIIDKLSA